MKRSDIEFELYCNYIDSELIEKIMEYVDTKGFHAQTIDAMLVEQGYEEIFSDVDERDYQESYVQKISHRRHLDEN
ncbi:MAG: hypothetical protein IE889_04110 [Campylobacterales bacterium]|nr:hypothetical protein [Campylobacterales bacterium]